jgi:hypothetical protein
LLINDSSLLPSPDEQLMAMNAQFENGHHASRNAGKHKIIYKVRKGELLSEIADKFNVSARELRTWNKAHFRNGKKITPGKKLVIYAERA